VLRPGDQIIVLGPPDELETFTTRTGATMPVSGEGADA
jgi:hypothetical protein